MTVHRIVLFVLLSVATPILAQGPLMDSEELKALRTYCKADVERLCPNVQPGGGRVKACLMANKDQMSVGCAKALQKLKQSKQ
ncbi:MAG: cysteine rich repeat-containing protein [Methylococcaceae bacterium]|nr:cysteine rich repeat-containing protein [Methylococcaceae bacterium]MCI0734119.1 cysteine rich repeat-containing protein [Methylococcaceae bacterium]